jgi:DNA-directed RNA polymerase II subunit RPB2
VLEFLDEWTTEPLEEVNCSIIPSSTKVFLNGMWVGIHRNPVELVRTLRSLRRQVSRKPVSGGIPGGMAGSTGLAALG